MFTKSDRALLFLNGKQAGKDDNWFKNDSYTLGTEWRVHYYKKGVDDNGKPYYGKIYEGYINFVEPFADVPFENNTPLFADVTDVPFEIANLTYKDLVISSNQYYRIHVYEDGQHMHIVDALTDDLIKAGKLYTFIMVDTSLSKVNDSDLVIVE